MKRNDFIKNSGLLLTGAFLSSNKTSDFIKPDKEMIKSTPFKLDYAPHQGMFSASAGKSFLDEIKYMHDLGFRSIEDNGMPGRSIEEQTKIGELLAKLGMRMGVFVVPKGGNGQNTLAEIGRAHV